MSTASPSKLTPPQQRVADELLLLGEERPVADLGWAPDLTDWLELALEEHAPHIGKRRLWLSKSSISGVLSCEAHQQADHQDFRWTPRTARGEIVHRAVALASAGSNSEPRDLAWAALDQAKLDGRGSLAMWLRGLPDDQRVALVAEALPAVDGFLSSWPPLQTIWRPVPEYPVGVDLVGGRVKVTGRVDLALGSNRVGPDNMLRRKKMLIELKTGRPNYEHRAEHLLYALLETLRVGLPPFRAATYYLDDGSWVADTITEELLALAARRLADAVQRIIELTDGREPTRRAGWRCAFCPLADGCAERLRAGEQELGQPELG